MCPLATILDSVTLRDLILLEKYQFKLDRGITFHLPH